MPHEKTESSYSAWPRYAQFRKQRYPDRMIELINCNVVNDTDTSVPAIYCYNGYYLFQLYFPDRNISGLIENVNYFAFSHK